MKLADLLKNSKMVDSDVDLFPVSILPNRYDVHLGLRMQIERAFYGLQIPTIVYRSQCRGTNSAR